jgi:hypothetical protein
MHELVYQVLFKAWLFIPRLFQLDVKASESIGGVGGTRIVPQDKMGVEIGFYGIKTNIRRKNAMVAFWPSPNGLEYLRPVLRPK